MHIRKKILAWVLLSSLLLTVGCSGLPEIPAGQKPTEPEETTKPTETVVTTAATEPEDPLEALREEMAGTACAFAVAYAGDTYEEGQRDAAALLSGLAPELCRQWPFLTEIPTENIVDLGWGEIYCIIPTDPEATIRVSKAVEQEYGYWDYTEVVYEGTAGEPILLICNGSEYWPDAQVIITSGNVETDWYPQQDKYRRVAPLTDESGKPLFLDISSYAELFTREYLEVADWDAYRLPEKEELVGTAWGFEGTALYEDYFTTYLLAFAEDTAFIRWYDGFYEETCEIQNIPWDLTHMDGYAVLTLDLGGFAGVRSYNLLYSEEFGWLYTMVDLTAGDVAVGDEIPFRYLEARSLDAPDPVEMVGTWERFRWETDGYMEEDTSGTCTIVIAGETEDTLTISFTDLERPEFDYHDKALDVRQGVVYTDCGNNLWLAEVDHVGPWDTTYTVTLLEDGTLMLQNYFTIDGAPVVSYEWYRRAG